ncbi:gliding motility protein GldL [Algoriphagus winogradskyi]|jgi:gliding motility-associated protein GldL|uniref:Gliding motility-associated protein GldL n=1 Tax=Algoriphagus winogradskyi TaxID=237017 RepID=A0ABY1P9E9_9BACT|nr:gliding motility protein GldL [Algoriphagus winogradskyi]SMP28077.1 gliding motility-associated protein GldL [Algoriphagus winogradskyi]
MASKSNSFSATFYTSIMPKIYGIGAAVVILGAMFKILDLPFANWMIGIGLSTEAFIFFLSAFEPQHKEVDWSKVYPELAGDTPAAPRAQRVVAGGGDQVSQKLDEMLANAKVGPELIESLGKGMQNLATSAQKMGNLSDAAVATNEYATNVKSAAKTLVDMNASYSKTAAALTEMSSASQDAKAYHTQVVTVTKNLSALNSVYEMELQDANSHVKTLNKFYANMTAAMEGLTEAGKETQAFKTELSKLNQNVSSLNKIYGGMLSAMKG